ncbi:polymorphic toxin-type HINT domain-containing protein [Streptomyces sp. NPDC090025]|uniref:polymorphic toxin-type HINT domain-containing protein n=1 Tax=Streptomyces sp. NPDC090025 TaxID=3365922 RepID=UPI0038330F5E
MVLTAVLAVLLSLVTVPVADAAAGPHPKAWTPPNTKLTKTRSVEGTDDPGQLGTSPSSGTKDGARWRFQRRPVVPTGSATVTLPAPTPAASASAAAPAAKATGGRKPAVTRAGELPVAVADLGAPRRTARKATGPAGAGSGSAAVSVTVHDAAASKAAGAFGNLISVRGASPATADGRSVRVELDVKTLEGTGGWHDRARLVAMPACALTTPAKAACRTRTPVVSSVDPVTGKLTADITLPAAAPAAPAATAKSGTSGASGAPAARSLAAAPQQAGAGVMLLGAEPAPSGSGGSFAATPISPSASWSAGSNSGNFTYSYTLSLPTSIGGAAPSAMLGYDSSTVDGMTAASNSQSSWLGEGWNYHPGFISRQYTPCLKSGIDMSGDECWAGQFLSLNLAGHSGQVVKDDQTGELRLQGDDGTKITPLTGLNNGAWNGEGFKVTTTDGTEYWFGANHLPGGDGSDPATQSVSTVPVYHPKAGDPCYNASKGAGSWCQMGWQWNLDHIVDLHGNLISYTYTPETNYYARGGGQNNGTGSLTKYERYSLPHTVSYGQRLPEQVAAKGTLKPAVVMTFTAAERCLEAASDCEDADRTLANKSRWKDSPLDQACAATGTCTVYGPTFWTSRRLAEVKTEVLVGGGYRTVDSWALTHRWSYPEDGTGSPTLWLASIQRTGSNGGTPTTLPPVTFTDMQLPNRVDEVTTTALRFYRPRMSAIVTETGGQINIGYKDAECSRQRGTMPASPETNAMPCMPVKWVKPGSPTNTKPSIDWFNKYLVGSISQESKVTSGVGRITEYAYGGGAAWHRNDSEFADEETRTWDNFRGYATVTTTTGNGTLADGPKSKSVVTFLRGMGGQVPDSWGGTITDEEEYAGFVRETQTFESVAPDAKVLSGELSTPYRSEPTVTHTPSVSGVPKVTARFVNTQQVRERARLADGTWRETKREVVYDTDRTHAGRVLKVDVFGDVTKPEQRQCTETTYATGTNAMLVELPQRVLTLAGTCGQTPNAGNTIADTRMLFDDQPLGTVGGRALQTSNEILASYDADGTARYRTTVKTAYDKYGRQISTVDPNNTDASHRDGTETRTAYTPSEGALPTSLTVTNPLGWSSTTTMDPGRGLPTRAVDENGHATDEEYDSVGRLVAVWKPGRDKATQSPHQKFAYDLKLERNAPAAITTQNIREDGSYGTSIQIHDGFGRIRQTQAMPPFGSVGRLISDAIFDSQGRQVKTTPSYFNDDSGPTATVFDPQDAQIPAQTWNEYDGLGRVTVSKFMSYGQEQWRDSTVYAGADRVDVIPPPGGSASSTFTDGLGRTTEVRQYKAATLDGAYDTTLQSFDAAGRVVLRKDSSGNEWRYGYDLLGQPTSNSDPDAGESRTTYDALGRAVTTTDARGKAISFTYDLLGRQTAAYDGTDTSNPAKKTLEWTYDTKKKGKPDSATRFVNGVAYKSTVNGYDIGYRPTGMSMTIPASEGALAGTYTSSVTYTPVLGLPKTTTLPAISGAGLTAERLTNSYDVDGNFIGSSGKSALVTDVQYDAFGRPTRTTVGPWGTQVVSTQLYDAGTGRVVQSTLDKQTSDTTHVDLTSYTYNKAGSLTSASTVQDGTAVDTQCFTYDYLGRLSAAWTDKGGTSTAPAPSVSGIGGCNNPNEPTSGNASVRVGGPAPYWQSYGYDLTGNRTKLVRHDPAGATAKDQTVDQTFATGRNTPTSAPDTGGGTGGPHALAASTTTVGGEVKKASYQYDASGNTTSITDGSGTKRLNWNIEGQIDSVQDTATAGTTSYVYDSGGNQLIRRTGTAVTLFLGSDEITLDKGTGTLTDTRTYPAPGGLSVTRVTKGGSARLVYQASDPHGTNGVQFEAGTLASTRRPSDPFGNGRGTQPGAGDWAGSQGFVGGTIEGTGFTTLGARQYDPLTGRFLSLDPVFNESDPQSWNGYAYANNNPVDYSDPTGTCIPADDGSGRCMSAAAWNAYFNKNSDTGTGTGDDTPTSTGSTPATNQAKNDNAAKQAAAAEALRQKQAADEALARAKQQREELMSKIVDVVGDLIGFNDARDCFTKGDVMGCVNTALNFVPWSKVFKAVKVGIKAFKLWKEGEKAYDAIRSAQRISKQAEEALVVARKTADEAASAESAAVQAERQAAEDAARSADNAGSCPIKAPHSFPAGTPVQLADGTTKAIEEVEKGDLVLATDPQTGLTRAETVEQLITTPDDKEFTDLSLTSDAGGSSALTTTWHHPFWDATARRWTDASELEAGSRLRTPDGTLITVTRVRNYHEAVVTYDLTVNRLHTYYVLAGDAPVLVHNCGPGADEVQAIRAKEINDAEPSQADFDVHTTAVLDVEVPGVGARRLVAGNGAQGLTPAQITALAPDEIHIDADMVPGDLHAEQRVIFGASLLKATPVQGGASRNICRKICGALVFATGGAPFGKVQPGNGKKTHRVKSMRW